MAGIVSYGAYIPKHRLNRADIGKAWGGAAPPGEKAVANYDEDSITMAATACMGCVKGFNQKKIGSLYFASTTFPYKEKQSAAIIATAMNLTPESCTVDISNSLRSGADAVKLGLDAVRAKETELALVCAADTRLGLPNGPKEMDFGDGAAALLLGENEIIASIDAIYTCYDEILDIWRSKEDTFVRSSEDRFGREAGYTRVVKEAIAGALKKFNLTARDFASAILYAPNPGALTGVVRELGFDPRTQVQDSLYAQVGNTGSALSMMMLVAALEKAKPGDRLLWVSYGDGCHVYILTVQEQITKARDRRGIKGNLDSKQYIQNYERYLRWREIVPLEPPARPPLGMPSAVALWRDRKGGLSLCGVKCKNCGTPQYPAQRVCVACKTKDKFEEYFFSDKVGKIVSFSHDNLAASVDPPTTLVVVDFEGGGRIMCDMTDREVDQVKVGMPVEMTFRQVRNVGGIHDYWWKCQPVR